MPAALRRARHASALLAVAVSLLALPSQAQNSLAERLGYPADTKLLILHADDLGVAHSENQASFSALLAGPVNSASIMVPCPWLPEVARFARAMPKLDLGLHLTLTSEWRDYKWSSTAPRDSVSSLVDSLGYFYDNCADMAKHARLGDIERELRAQIKKALAMGINPTHLDSHMGCLFFNFERPEYLALYLRLGREFGIPAMISQNMIDQFPEMLRKVVGPSDLVVDNVLTATPEDFKGGMPAYYERTLRELKPGVNVLLMHLAYTGSEMQGVTVNHTDWGAEWRQADFDYFNSEACRKTLEEMGIRLITWREVGKLMK
ncbi:MAG: polysaccharide deacetylase family protein [Saprospiraceae bacterium]|nr:polysaccharide deacetylase family protein [Saprospiraceae bacterium]